MAAPLSDTPQVRDLIKTYIQSSLSCHPLFLPSYHSPKRTIQLDGEGEPGGPTPPKVASSEVEIASMTTWRARTRYHIPSQATKPDPISLKRRAFSWRLQDEQRDDTSASLRRTTQLLLLTTISPMTPVDILDAAPLDVFDPLDVLEAGSFKKKWPRRHPTCAATPTCAAILTCTPHADQRQQRIQ